VYRADWKQLCLSATIIRTFDAGVSRRLAERTAAEFRQGLGPLQGRWQMPPVDDEDRGLMQWERSLLIAPGGRYRVEQSARFIVVCDGEQRWHVDGDVAHRRPLLGPGRDFDGLLTPQWLIACYDLQITGTDAVGGRAAIRVTGTPRLASTRRRSRYQELDRVEVLVDAELGILLGSRQIFDGQTLESAELRDLVMNPPEAAIPGRFELPPNVPVEDDEELFADFEPPSGAGWQMAGAAAGAAATALGFAIRHAPRRKPAWPTADEEPDMPRDAVLAAEDWEREQPPDGRIVNLLHRLDLAALALTGEVHQWIDLQTSIQHFKMLQQKMPAAVEGIFGPDAVWDALTERATEEGAGHRVARLAVRMPGQYRLDYLSGRWNKRYKSIASDGDHTTKLFDDRVTTGPRKPLDNDFTAMLDPAWLLTGWQLAVIASAQVAGRDGVTIRATATKSQGISAEIRFTRAEVVVDAEFGVLLRNTTYVGDQPAIRTELRDLRPVDDDTSFRIVPGPGMRSATDSGGPLGDRSLPRPAEAAATAAALAAAGAVAVTGWLDKHRTRRDRR
jgi:hypothetical protein